MPERTGNPSFCPDKESFNSLEKCVVWVSPSSFERVGPKVLRNRIGEKFSAFVPWLVPPPLHLPRSENGTRGHSPRQGIFFDSRKGAVQTVSHTLSARWAEKISFLRPLSCRAWQAFARKGKGNGIQQIKSGFFDLFLSKITT